MHACNMIIPLDSSFLICPCRDITYEMTSDMLIKAMLLLYLISHVLINLDMQQVPTFDPPRKKKKKKKIQVGAEVSVDKLAEKTDKLTSTC